MARYDAIRGAGNVTVQAPPDFWTAAKQSFDDDYDRLTAAQERQEEKDRYDTEKLEEQTRYNTEQENLMFQQRYDKAVAAHQAATDEYTLASNQIGPENPEAQARLNKQYSKEYRVPIRKGGYEVRRVVPQAVVDYNTVQVKSKGAFDLTLSQWDDKLLTNEQKIAAWPQIKRLNKFFNEQIEPYEESYKRALSYDDNKTLLDSMGAFLPAGYTTEKWDKAISILLKDGDVSDAELKLIAGDVSTHIVNKKDAHDFWVKWSSDVIKARAALDPYADISTVSSLASMSDIALEELGKWYPGISKKVQGKATEEEINQLGDALSNELYGKPYNDLSTDEQAIVSKQIIDAEKAGQPIKSAIYTTPEKKEEEELPLEKQSKSGFFGKALRKGKPIKDPVTLQYMDAFWVGKAVHSSPFTYAKAGLIPTEKWPGFKEVKVKEALEHYQKNKHLYKKDEPVIIEGVWPWSKDIEKTQYPKE